MYKKILEFLINEREQRDLQRPPPEFMSQVEAYLESLSKEENALPERLREAEKDRIKWMLERIRLLRREKICKRVLEGGSLEGPLFEEELALLGSAKKEGKEEGAKKILVRVLRDVPSFVGADMRTYGPYKAEDVVLLPAQNAEALINRGIAMMIQRKV